MTTTNRAAIAQAAQLGIWARIYIRDGLPQFARNLITNHPRYDWSKHLSADELALVGLEEVQHDAPTETL
jgi:aminoglycoside/choline kinase family phosphotransferase